MSRPQMPNGHTPFRPSRSSHDRDILSSQRKTTAMSSENDTASIASTSTFSSTISLVKKKFTISSSATPKASKSKSKSNSDSKERKSPKSQKQDESDKMIFEIGVGAISYSPYQSSYPGTFKGDFPRWGPGSDLDEKMVKVDEGSGNDEAEGDGEEEMQKQEKEKRRAERKNMEREMVRFPYTTASLMRP